MRQATTSTGRLFLLLAFFALLAAALGGTGQAAPAADGELDPAFGAAGKVITDFPGATQDTINDMVQLGDGRLLTVGYVYANFRSIIAMARYNADGSLDSTFGTGGRVEASLSSTSSDFARALTIDWQGRILVVGSTGFSPHTDFFVARFTPDGRFDTTFGDNGKVITDLGGEDGAADVAVLGDQRVLVVGGGGTPDTRIAIARYSRDGHLDPFLDGTGKTTVDLGPGIEAARRVHLLQTYGPSFMIAGSAGGDFMLAVFNGNGHLSVGSPFGTRGVVRTDFHGRWDEVNDMHVDDRFNTIILAGRAADAGWQDNFALARYDASDGYLRGKTTTDFNGGPDSAQVILRQTDGKTVLIGSTTVIGEEGSEPNDFALARYIGFELDPSFGQGGKVITDFNGGNDAAFAAIIQFSGRIVAAGYTAGRESMFALAGYRSGVAGPPTTTPTLPPTSIPEPTPTSGPGCSFSDVCPGDFFFTPVQELVRRGAISGYGDNTFRPYNNTTRGQLAKIIVIAEAFGITTGPTQSFGDVDPGHPFYSWIETAARRGIISGYDDGTFRPYNNVTRGQLAKIVVVAEGWTLANPPTPTFRDVPRDNTFYAFIETAYAHGIISGYDDGTFRWGNNATRGQIAKIVYQAITE